MPSITRKFTFDAGHRVLGHRGKCRHLHGHRYVAEVTVVSDDLDSLGMVVDFAMVKDKVGWWIDNNWDHNLILNPADPMVRLAEAPRGGPVDPDLATWTDPNGPFGGRCPYLMPDGQNPTAENLAVVLLDKAAHCLSHSGLKVVQVRMWETENCYADAYKE